MSKFISLLIGLVLIGTIPSGCFLIKKKKPVGYSAFTIRAGVAGTFMESLSPKDRKLILNGQFRIGLPELAMYIARGEPTLHWRTKIGNRDCKVLVYSRGGKSEYAVYTCSGIIVHWADIKPTLPCWRFRQVAPRLIEKAAYFDGLPLQRQWELVAGILKRGQTTKDIYIAYGKPYNNGMEEREDGTRSDTQIFLDHGQEAYGLDITLINDSVVGWKIPAKRTLTPEAEKRRLELTEQRLMAKLKQLDENAERRHKETVDLLHNVLSNQDEMKDSLDNIDASIEDAFATMANAESPDVGVPMTDPDSEGPASTPETCPSGSKTFKLNSCTYMEIPGKCQMGRKCDSDNPCLDEYACNVMGSSLSSAGICLPHDHKYSKCDEPRYQIGNSCKRSRDCKGVFKGAECYKKRGKKRGYCRIPLDDEPKAF